jgi:hypothetical protein
MPGSFWIFVLGVLLLAAITAVSNVVGRYRRRRIERLMLSGGAVKNEDGSLTFSESGFQFRRNVARTGVHVGAGEVPIFCATNEVDIPGVDPFIGSIRMTRGKSEWSRELINLADNFGSTPFVDMLEPIPGYRARVSDPGDSAATVRLMNAFRSLLDSRLVKSWSGWPMIMIDVSSSNNVCRMAFHALDSLAALNKRRSVSKLSQIALVGCRALLSEFKGGTEMGSP